MGGFFFCAMRLIINYLFPVRCQPDSRLQLRIHPLTNITNGSSGCLRNKKPALRAGLNNI